MEHTFTQTEQAVLYAAIGGFVLSFALLYFRRGIAMQFALLVSLAGGIYLCYAFGRPSYAFWVFLACFAVWLYQLKCYTSLLAKDQLDREWAMIMSDFEAESIDPENYPELDLEFYDAQTKLLQENGFYKLDDLDFSHVSRQMPFIHTFNRAFLNEEHDTAAVVAQQKATVVIVPLFLTFRADVRYVELSTEFTDGTFLNTNNTQGAADMEVEGMTMDYHPQGTATEILLRCHRENIERIRSERNVAPKPLYSMSDFYAAAIREHAVIREDRLKKGGVSVEMSRREVRKGEGQLVDDGATEYYKEYLEQAKQRAEKEKKRQEDGFF